MRKCRAPCDDLSMAKLAYTDSRWIVRDFLIVKHTDHQGRRWSVWVGALECSPAFVVGPYKTKKEALSAAKGAIEQRYGTED